jgi:hypothetical protein
MMINLREEVRKEMQSKKSKWWVDIAYINNYLWTLKKEKLE